MSSRRAAKLAGVSPTTGVKARHKLEVAGHVSTVDTSIDTKGRKQPTHKPAKKKRRDIDDKLAENKAKMRAEHLLAEIAAKADDASIKQRIIDDDDDVPAELVNAAAATMRKRVFLRCAESAIRKAEQGAGLRDAKRGEIDSEIWETLNRVIKTWTKLRDEISKRSAYECS